MSSNIRSQSFESQHKQHTQSSVHQLNFKPIPITVSPGLDTVANKSSRMFDYDNSTKQSMKFIRNSRYNKDIIPPEQFTYETTHQFKQEQPTMIELDSNQTESHPIIELEKLGIQPEDTDRINTQSLGSQFRITNQMQNNKAYMSATGHFSNSPKKSSGHRQSFHQNSVADKSSQASPMKIDQIILE